MGRTVRIDLDTEERKGERLELYRREKCASSAPLMVSSCQVYIYVQQRR